MTRGFAAAAGLAFVLTGHPAGDARAQSNEGSIRADREHERVIRDLYRGFMDAWNRHDVAALAAMWAIDGDHLEPDGTRAEGRERVRRLLERQHDTIFKESRLDLTLDDVWFVTGEVSLVDGTYTLTGARMPDGEPLPMRRGRLTSLLLHEDGKWWITASRLMVPVKLPYKP